MKSFTDIEQSKTLAKILPIESADMRYGYIAPYEYSDRMYDGGYDDIPYPKDFLKRNPNFSEDEYDGSLPCWSLAALLEVLPRYIEIDGYISFLDIYKTKNLGWVIEYSNHQEDFVEFSFDSQELIDACVEMIVKLKEKGLI